MDDFSPILSKHLKEEVDTLLALDNYGERELKKAWKDFDKGILNSADKVILQCILPPQQQQQLTSRIVYTLPFGIWLRR